MAKYQKSNFVGGAWVKGKDIMSGTRCKLVSETNPQSSQFENKDGSPKLQDVAKIRFEGKPDPLNISINRASLNALIDAFGEGSKDWIGKTLTAVTEKVLVGGKRVTALYLLPEGYEAREDENGYMTIVNPNKESIVADPEMESVNMEAGSNEF